MTFSIRVDKAKLTSLFKFQVDFINVYVTEAFVFLYADASDIFTLFDTKHLSIVGYSEPTSFRIPKQEFLNVLVNGVVTFRVLDTVKVHIVSEPQNDQDEIFEVDMEFSRQICSISEVDAKIGFIKNATSYPEFPVKDLINPIKLLKNSQLPLNIESGYAFSSYNCSNSQQIQIYAKTNCKDCAVFPATLNFLIQISQDLGKVYDVKNLIISSFNNYHVVIQKAVSHKASDLEFICRQPILYKADIDFSSALQLLRKIKFFNKLELNLENSQMTLVSNNCSYSTPFLISEQTNFQAETNDKSNLDILKLDLPQEVLKDLMFSYKTNKAQILVTKRFTRVMLSNNSNTIMLIC